MAQDLLIPAQGFFRPAETVLFSVLLMIVIFQNRPVELVEIVEILF
jgi:hypothetical protein